MWTTDWPTPGVALETIVVLRRSLGESCDEQGCQAESEACGLAARNLIRWYEFGVRDERELAKLICDDISISDA